MNNPQKNTLRAILLGVVAAIFLSSTFSINSLLSHSGGHWAWTACLRSLFMIPIMAASLLVSKKFGTLLHAIRSYPFLFIKWGVAGFGVLYTCMALASLFIPGWLVAATFQLNILAGILMSPFLYKDQRKKIPPKALALSIIIIVGVMVMQIDRLEQLDDNHFLITSFLLVLTGAIAWPLANRKLLIELEIHGIELTATQRVLGLTIGSLPLLMILAGYAHLETGEPPFGQLQASFLSALFSGYVGGVAFYHATQMVKQDSVALATVEATQVFEILFTLITEICLIQAALPGIFGVSGMAVIFIGMAVQIVYAVRNSGDSSTVKPTAIINAKKFPNYDS